MPPALAKDETSVLDAERIVLTMQALDRLIDEAQQYVTLGHMQSILSGAKENLIFWVGNSAHYNSVSAKLTELLHAEDGCL